MRASLVAAAVVLCASAAPRPASGYSCSTTTCVGWCQLPIDYRLGQPSNDMGLEISEREVQRAFNAWTMVGCTSLKTRYAGRTGEPPSSGNGVAAWVESNWSFEDSAIGVTTLRLEGGCLTGHMHLNGQNFRWVPNAPSRRGDVNAFSIIAHEAGHYYGLGHSTEGGALMAPRYPGGVLAIGSDDKEGICRIYPGGGGGPVNPPTCPESPCPTGFVCIAKVCHPPPDGGPGGQDAATADARSAADLRPADASTNAADATFDPVPPPDTQGGPSAPSVPDAGSSALSLADDGQRCDTHEDCRSSLCIALGGEPAVCSRVCQANADCGSGFACTGVPGEKVCLRPTPVEGSKSLKQGRGCSVSPGQPEARSAWILWVIGLVVVQARLRRRRRVASGAS